MLISDDFGYLRDALSRCEAYLVNSRRADDANVIVGNHDNLLRAVRLALSVIDMPHATRDELRAVIGERDWIITKAGRPGARQQQRHPGAVAIPPKRFRESERRAIERRVNQGGTEARLGPAMLQHPGPCPPCLDRVRKSAPGAAEAEEYHRGSPI